MIKVSVNIVTYNQARFIAEAIESALAQETTFPYEIIVADDCSTDGTREIIERYQEQYPDKIRAILHRTNLGGAGKFNAISAIEASRGDYIATMDGDDYWTHPGKLQKQVAFLDAHPECSTCFHNAHIIWEDGSFAPEVVNGPDQKEISTVEDLVGEDEIWFMATSSVMFRNGLLKEYPDWFYQSKSGDIPRYILLAKKGKIGYLPDVMSVYRKNRDGVSQTDYVWDAEFLYNRIGMYQGINQELNYRFNRVLRKNIARYYKMMLEAKQYRSSYFKRLGVALKYIQLGRPNWQDTKEVLQKHIIPAPVMRLYSAIRLLPYR